MNEEKDMSAVDPVREDAERWLHEDAFSRGLVLLVVELVLIVLLLVIVSLRIYSRSFLSRIFGLEDWFIALATVFYIGFTITTCLATFDYGWRNHIYNLPPPTVAKALKLLWISELFFTWSLCFTKLSVCVFYLRLLNTRLYRRIIYICMAVVALWAFGFSAGIIAQCNPVKAAWSVYPQPGERCASIEVGIVAHAVVDILTNLILWTLPAKLMLGSGLRGKQRALILGLFVLSGIVCAAAITRVPYTIYITRDATWYLRDSSIWSALEASLAIICASLPSLSPLLAKIVPNLYHNEYDDQSHLSHSRCSIVKGSSFGGGGELTLVGSAFPLAHISTTAISDKCYSVGSGGGSGCNWFHWPMRGGGGGGASGISNERKGPNESEENIVIGSNDTLAGGMGITKTTVIEQSIDDGMGIERRSPSPKLVGRVTF